MTILHVLLIVVSGTWCAFSVRVRLHPVARISGCYRLRQPYLSK